MKPLFLMVIITLVLTACREKEEGPAPPRQSHFELRSAEAGFEYKGQATFEEYARDSALFIEMNAEAGEMTFGLALVNFDQVWTTTTFIPWGSTTGPTGYCDIVFYFPDFTTNFFAVNGQVEVIGAEPGEYIEANLNLLLRDSNSSDSISVEGSFLALPY